MRRALAAAALAGATLLTFPALADVTLATWPGIWGDALEEQADAYAEATGQPVTVLRHDGRLSPFRHNGAGANPSDTNDSRLGETDLLDIETGAANLLCDEGISRVVPPSFWEAEGRAGALLKLAQHDCGVGFLVTSFAIAGGADADMPRDWAGFFDTEKFPGPRAVPGGPRGLMEAALLADGISASEVYPLLDTEDGVARAVAKLKTLAPHVALWWDSPDQALSALNGGDVSFAAMPHGPAARWNRDHSLTDKNRAAPLQLTFGGQVYRVERLAVLAPTGRGAEAFDLLGHIVDPRPQAALARATMAGPVAREAWIHIPVQMARWLPTAPGHEIEMRGLSEDADFWLWREDELAERFEAFLGGIEPALP